MVGAVGRTREANAPADPNGGGVSRIRHSPIAASAPSTYTRSMLKLLSVVIRVTDLPAQSAFWKAVLTTSNAIRRTTTGAH